jgi:hypothetical protein
MNEIEIILSSFSIGDLTVKLFGYSNSKTKEKAIEILEKNGFTTDIFLGKNKNVKYQKISKVCPVCKSEFITMSGHEYEKKTCSISCSNSANPKRKKTFNKKIKSHKLEKKECLICNSTFTGLKKTKTCSKECSNLLISNIIKEKVRIGEHKGWTSRNIVSYPEKFFMEVLNNLEIPFEFNFPVSKSSLGINSSASYFLDFYIQKDQRKIDLEIDGKQHEYQERKESDKLRDHILEKNGFEIFRIKWKNPINEQNKIYLKEEIIKFQDFIKKQK